MTLNFMNLNKLRLPADLQQQGLLGICLATAAAVLITSLYSAWQWHQDWTMAHRETIAAPAMNTTDFLENTIKTIPDNHIFGANTNKLGNIPISNLQFRVTGIVKMENSQQGANSKAYISTAGQISKIYQTGDLLPYGVKVYEISSNAVILQNDGHLERLPLPRESLQFKTKPIRESA